MTEPIIVYSTPAICFIVGIIAILLIKYRYMKIVADFTVDNKSLSNFEFNAIHAIIWNGLISVSLSLLIFTFYKPKDLRDCDTSKIEYWENKYNTLNNKIKDL